MLFAPLRFRFLVFALLLAACTPAEVGCEPRLSSEEAELPPPPNSPDAPRIELGDGPPARVDAAPGASAYLVSLPHPETHYLELEASFPAGGDTLELMMAVWTPGSYLVREFARNVEDVGAFNRAGDPLAIDKTRKNRWVVSSENGPLPEEVVVRYRVYARELSVRTSFVDAELMVLSPASVFLVDPEHLERPSEVRFELPEGWVALSGNAQARGDEAAPDRFAFADFDALVDAPIVGGRPCGPDGVAADPACRVLRSPFTVDEVEYELVTLDAGAAWDQARAVGDLERLVQAQHRFWQVVPYEHYTFFNVLGAGGGGLEHRFSTVFMGDRWLMRDPQSYRDWLGLVSHEFFHAWNVKRLRPEPLGPFDYEQENYVSDLWIAEGITSYYDDLLVLRAGLMTRDEYLAALTRTIERVQQTPGRLEQSLSEASFDAWIKFYRPDEHSVNTQISYYRKGLLVAFLLDQRIRELTRGRRSLDDVMRLAYERYSGTRGYTTAEFRAVCDEVAGVSLADFFARNVDGHEELSYERALAPVGLRFAPLAAVPEPTEDARPGAYLGVETREEHGRLVVSGVRSGTPAFEAGVNVGDELIALDGERLPSDLGERLARVLPGEHRLLVARRARLRELAVALIEPERESWRIEVDPQANPLQRRALDAWLAAD